MPTFSVSGTLPMRQAGAPGDVLTPSADDRLAHIRAVAERVAAGYGLEIFDVQLRRDAGGWLLRVIIDRPAASDAGEEGVVEEPVSIADCQRVSEDLGTVLDVEDAIEHAYTLEVSSPGLDRPLRHADDYRRFRGRLAKIVVASPLEGQSHFEGRLQGMDGDDVLLQEGRRLHRVPLAAIRRARLEVEF